MTGSRNVTSASARSNSGTAAAIIDEWKAPVTSSSIARKPSALAASIPAGMLALAPDRTICIGELSLATVSDDASAISWAWSAAPAPITATIEPSTGLQPRLVHQLAAERDQGQRVTLVDRARGDKRSELAERVAGHQFSDGRADRRPAGETRAEDRGLSEVGAVVGPRERVLADLVDRRLQQVRALPRDQFAHLRRLASLTREQDRGRWWPSGLSGWGLRRPGAGRSRRRGAGTRFACSSASTYVEVMSPIRSSGAISPRSGGRADRQPVRCGPNAR